MKPANKYLLINRHDHAYAPYESIPGYLQSQLIPHARYYADMDDNGIIIDQKIEMEGLSIYFHLIYLKEGVELTTVPPRAHLLPAGFSGFSENNASTPMRMVLGKKEENLVNTLPQDGTIVSEKEFIINFHVNLDFYNLSSLTKEFPSFGVIKALGQETMTLPNKSSFPVNEVNYQLMKRILDCKLISKAADVFFRRSAINFYSTYLCYLQLLPPVMLHENHRQQLRQIADYIIQHPSDAGSIEDLCDKFNVVPEFLEELFEQEFFISVEALIEQEKMALAFKLITTTNHTLTYIATQTKHNNWEDLTKEFELYYKCNIADLRKAQ